jgi:MFS family permease
MGFTELTQVCCPFCVQMKSIVRSLRHRNFRLFFSGQSISLIGTWMQRIALGWLVYRLTNSAFLLGLVGFAGQIPTFLLAPFAGVLADRRDRHHILILTQILAMAQAFVLSFLVLFDLIRIWHVIFLSIVLGIINAFDMPTRQSLCLQLCAYPRYFIDICPRQSGRNALYRADAGLC